MADMMNGFTIVTTPKDSPTMVDEGELMIAAFVFTKEKVILRTDSASIEALKRMPAASKAVVLDVLHTLSQRLEGLIR